MDRNSTIRAISVAALEVGALCLLAAGAFAAPPSARQPHLLQVPAQHLDLRPPSHSVEPANLAGKPTGTFPSMAHRINSAPEKIELPMLGSDSMRARPTIQEFVHRVRREGLPVARLFETKSALLHLGLSPRGKPGLWLVQKTH